MNDLHKLTVSAPDGTVATATVTLDGQPIRCRSIVIRCCAGGSNAVTAVIDFDAVDLELDGLADVTARIAPAG